MPTAAAVCGLYCEACSISIGSPEDPARPALLAARRTEIHKNLDRMAEIGVEAWSTGVSGRSSRPASGTLNSACDACDVKCRSRGHEPGSAYVAAHRDATLERLRLL